MTVEKFKAVIAAYKSGEISPETKLVLDNDTSYWVAEFEAEAEALEKKFGTPDGHNDLVNLAIAAGINADWC